MDMTKILDVMLLVPEWGSQSLPSEVKFQMVVPVNVFSQGELILSPAAGSSQSELYMREVLFRPRTDGTVQVKGFSHSHNLREALAFLAEHPDISNVQQV
jgi:hypothetical protein